MKSLQKLLRICLEEIMKNNIFLNNIYLFYNKILLFFIEINL